MDTVADLRRALSANADPDRAEHQRRYMRDRFEFLGLAMSTVRSAAKPFVTAHRVRGAAAILDTADELWHEPEREFQYVGVDLLRAGVRHLDGDHRGGDHLDRVAALIRHRSWWDTVDALASHVVGGIVDRDRERLQPAIDRWAADDDIWIARTAILHQLRYGTTTDTGRLFGYVDRRAGDTEFFIRKACGWALREYAKHDPEAVRAYVADRGDRLSGLTRREATKHL